ANEDHRRRVDQSGHGGLGPQPAGAGRDGDGGDPGPSRGRQGRQSGAGGAAAGGRSQSHWPSGRGRDVGRGGGPDAGARGRPVGGRDGHCGADRSGLDRGGSDGREPDRGRRRGQPLRYAGTAAVTDRDGADRPAGAADRDGRGGGGAGDGLRLREPGPRRPGVGGHAAPRRPDRGQ
uniref:Transcriptional regulator, AsnC family n=1 Tax=Parastrongyloides trichosuri TaxID=131310 RepID=A0A0N4ZGF5_PARTI